MYKKSQGTDYLSGIGEDWDMQQDVEDRARQFLLQMYGTEKTTLHEARLVCWIRLHRTKF